MHTQAECARALLIASGLPRFLWEEAFKHSNWLQNRTPAGAIKGKTPYEMKNNKKPHLAGIQEFSAAAYMKDLKAGKLDARAQVGRFVGYDLESKGYYMTSPLFLVIHWLRGRGIKSSSHLAAIMPNTTMSVNLSQKPTHNLKPNHQIPSHSHPNQKQSPRHN